MSNAEAHYFRAGSVERRDGHYGYRGHEGFSRVVPGGISYPWLTYGEVLDEAKATGVRAVFHETEAEARAAMSQGSPA